MTLCLKFINIDTESTRRGSASVGMVLMMHSTSFLVANVISHIRKVMISDIATIWHGSDNEDSLSLTVSFLLAPFKLVQ